YEAPLPNGPRSTTGATSDRPRKKTWTGVPQGSVRFATPIVVVVSRPPQASRCPYKPGPYQVARAGRKTVTCATAGADDALAPSASRTARTLNVPASSPGHVASKSPLSPAA